MEGWDHNSMLEIEVPPLYMPLTYHEYHLNACSNHAGAQAIGTNDERRFQVRPHSMEDSL